MTSHDNPLLAPWTGRYGLPPFDRIETRHFAPAFDAAMREHRHEVAAIANDRSPPTFDNTVAALDAAARTHASAPCSTTRGVEHLARAAGDRARDDAEARRARLRDPARREAVRARRRVAREARHAGPVAGATQAPRARASRFRDGGSEARAEGARARRRDRRAPGDAVDDVPEERAARRSHARLAPDQRGRPRRPAGVATRRGARGGQAARGAECVVDSDPAPRSSPLSSNGPTVAISASARSSCGRGAASSTRRTTIARSRARS